MQRIPTYHTVAVGNEIVELSPGQIETVSGGIGPHLVFAIGLGIVIYYAFVHNR